MDDDQETELRNPFPAPPSHYQNYTSHNIELLRLLNSRTEEAGAEDRKQRDILADQKDVPEWPLKQLEKPRVDWILEEGHYNVFGDTWFVCRSKKTNVMGIFLKVFGSLGQGKDSIIR